MNISFLALLASLFSANGGTTEHQAFAVAKAMRAHGCEAARIDYVGHGLAVPVCPGYRLAGVKMQQTDPATDQVAYWLQGDFDGFSGNGYWTPIFTLDSDS